jgi:hypothetical protein
MKRALLAVAALLFLAAPAAAQQDIMLERGQPYVQAASGMTFPPSVAGFGRSHRAVRYTADGANEGVSYRLTTDDGFVQATVYIYPSPSVTAGGAEIDAARRAQCAEEFANVGRELVSVHPNSEMLENGPTALMQNGVSFSGEKLAFTVRAPSAFGETHAPLQSEAYLFCYVGGRWNVKYRFTYALALESDDAIAAFMRDLTWTIHPDAL